MADITAVILTKNEEKNIVNCIEHIKGFVERIVVIDSGSDDSTVDLAKKLGAEVYVNSFVDYATQFNWGIDNTDITTEWILRIDADEFYTKELCEEIEQLLHVHANDDVNGIITESWFYFLGKCIKYGGPKKRKIVVFRRGHGFIEKRKLDEHTIINEGRVIQAKNRFIHHDYKDITTWIDKMNWYATREVQDYYIDMEKLKVGQGILANVKDDYLITTRRNKYLFYYRLPKFIRCWALFIYNYIFRLGFLDGKEGWVYHYMYQRWYRSLVDAKILEQELKNQNRI